MMDLPSTNCNVSGSGRQTDKALTVLPLKCHGRKPVAQFSPARDIRAQDNTKK